MQPIGQKKKKKKSAALLISTFLSINIQMGSDSNLSCELDEII